MELIKIENINGVNVVSSRVIAEGLGKRHADVLESIERILTNGDFRSLILPSNYKDKKGETRKEYLLTKDGFTLYMFNIQGYNEFKMAYINEFNRMEEHIKNKQKLTPAQQLLAHAQVIVDLENRVNEQEANIKRLEHNQRRLINNNHFTVIAYANINGIHASTYKPQVIGKKAKKLCVERGIPTGTIVDSKYGHINTYPSEILDEVFFKR
ncbi:Rha family transcriptional regulator [Streptobacillus moniliformis]|uniref:Rha family transcriptional regulator n=1 Tax=Streptobacillus moniliformis TaxID=34105 RepID=UPI0009C08746|nr:Rha family transcriptional regulator [Streptobacillus moniliformis]